MKCPTDVENKDGGASEVANMNLFNNVAWLYSEGQLSLEIAIHSTKLSKEEFLDKYDIYKQNRNK